MISIKDKRKHLPVAHNAPINEMNKFNFGTNSAIATAGTKNLLGIDSVDSVHNNVLQVSITITVRNINSYFNGFLNGPNV